MRIIRPNDLAGPKGNGISRSPARPDWYAQWLSNQGKWAMLACGCIEDVKLPQCVTLLTGKKVYIQCPFNEGHAFQLIKRQMTFREVLAARDITYPDDADPQGLFPPF